MATKVNHLDEDINDFVCVNSDTIDGCQGTPYPNFECDKRARRLGHAYDSPRTWGAIIYARESFSLLVPLTESVWNHRHPLVCDISRGRKSDIGADNAFLYLPPASRLCPGLIPASCGPIECSRAHLQFLSGSPSLVHHGGTNRRSQEGTMRRN